MTPPSGITNPPYDSRRPARSDRLAVITSRLMSAPAGESAGFPAQTRRFVAIAWCLIPLHRENREISRVERVCRTLPDRLLGDDVVEKPTLRVSGQHLRCEPLPFRLP